MDDVRGGAQREALEGLEEEFAGLRVHLVIHEPEGDLGDAHGPFADLDAVELIDIDGGEPGLAAADGEQFAEHLGLQRAQFAVGEDEEIAAAAGGVEELEVAELFVETLHAGAAAI